MKKDTVNFRLWLGVAKQWTTKNATMTKNIEKMEKEFSNWQ
jgi:hypothetical protein